MVTAVMAGTLRALRAGVCEATASGWAIALDGKKPARIPSPRRAERKDWIMGGLL
jgi:hypothetical protein